LGLMLICVPASTPVSCAIWPPRHVPWVFHVQPGDTSGRNRSPREGSCVGCISWGSKLECSLQGSPGGSGWLEFQIVKFRLCSWHCWLLRVTSACSRWGEGRRTHQWPLHLVPFSLTSFK
jgi:hypothetical protein